MSDLENDETYVPYFTTAEAIVAADDGVREYLLFLFPDATKEQLESLTRYTIARVLDGIHVGLDMAGQDPISNIEAYNEGLSDGLNFDNDLG